MKIEIITVGDELLIGQVVDTNSAWIGAVLGEAGAPVGRITSLSDNGQEIKAGVSEALGRADVVIMTGGLGPTKDDITKKSLAELFGVGLVRDQGVYEHVRQLTRERGFEFNALNQAQALVPEGITTVLENPVGTAPGMLFERDGKLLFALPGVPFEMQELVRERVIPIIRERFELRAVVHRTMMTVGLPESAMALRIAPWEEQLPEWLHLAYLPNPKGVRLRLSAYDVDHQAAEAVIGEQFEKLRGYIGTAMLGYEPASTEGAVAELLLAQGKTLAVAESCTGGAISARITALAGASKYYLGGVTAYSNDAKINLLDVSPEAIGEHGAVSREVVEQMAQGARRRFGADYAIATTGILGTTGNPAGSPGNKPVGTVWGAIAWAGGCRAEVWQVGALREPGIARASARALDLLRLHLLDPER